MMLISLLLVMALERVVVKSKLWRFATYTNGYRALLTSKGWLSESTNSTRIVLLTVLPALLIAGIMSQVGELLTFVLQTVVLLICIGCQSLRDTYKCFLNAANRGDLQACSLYTEELGHCDQIQDDDDQSAVGQGRSFGQHLLWLNYQHYAAVVLWFIFAGATGAVFYVFLRELQRSFCQLADERGNALSTILYVADYIPVRITAFGLLLVGHFSRALPVWMSLLTTKTRADVVLTRVAGAAEMVSQEEIAKHNDATFEPKILVKLAKRNILFLLVVTSLLTMSGTIS